MEPLKKPAASRHLAKFAKSMAACNTPVRNYAICVSSKGVAINKNECQKQFSLVMECVA